VPGVIFAAAVTPDNTPGGYILTFAAPIALFAVVAVILYLLFSRPHARIPARRIVAPAHAAAPDPDAARAAAVAGGLPLATGGGTAESQHEPAGAVQAAAVQDSIVSGQGGGPDDAERPDDEASATEGTEAGE
jgi:hypothetical protein